MSRQYWKPGNMLYPLPAVMVSCQREGEKTNIVKIETLFIPGKDWHELFDCELVGKCCGGRYPADTQPGCSGGRQACRI